MFWEFMFPFVEMYKVYPYTGAICRIIIFLCKSLTIQTITGLLFDWAELLVVTPGGENSTCLRPQT